MSQTILLDHLDDEFGVIAKMDIRMNTVLGQYIGFELSPLENMVVFKNTLDEKNIIIYTRLN